MALRKNWQETGRIVTLAGVRSSLAVLFWVWAIIGFFLVTVDIVNLMTRRGAEGVGVGSSAYVIMEVAYWTGGMVMFGLGGLMARTTLAIQRPAEA
jgi:hypothetical protein